jgi:molybdopterin molybdotransferase
MPDWDCDGVQDEMIPYDQALHNLLGHARAVEETESVALLDGLHRILEHDMTSCIDVPPADNSSMDGYAIRWEDVIAGSTTKLKISQRIPAGETGEKLQPGAAARIFTGASVPPDADAVIMQEQVEVDGEYMSFTVPVERMQNIRAAGEDIRQDQIVLRKGTHLRPQELGLAASIGADKLVVKRKVRVGIFFTGDELVEPGKPLAEGKIYDSNRYTLNGLLQHMGCEVVDLGIVGDTLEQTTRAIVEASENTDLVLTSGGVSVGEEDHVRIALEKLGEVHMWRLRIKPGKPLVFGKVNDTAFIGMPGNPVSVFATFCLFVSPFIKSLQGRINITTRSMQVIAGFDWPKVDSRREYARARLSFDHNNELNAEVYSNQSSGVLMSTSWGEGFVEIPENETITHGDRINYLSFSDLLG